MPFHTSVRLPLVFLFDLLAAAAAWEGGLLIHFNFAWPTDSGFSTSSFLILAGLLPIHALACYWAGLYRGIWRFASMPDLKRVLRAIVVSTAGLLAIKALFSAPGAMMPRSTFVLYPLLLATVMGGGRLAWRMWKEHWM